MQLREHWNQICTPILFLYSGGWFSDQFLYNHWTAWKGFCLPTTGRPQRLQPTALLLLCVTHCLSWKSQHTGRWCYQCRCLPPPTGPLILGLWVPKLVLKSLLTEVEMVSETLQFGEVDICRVPDAVLEDSIYQDTDGFGKDNHSEGQGMPQKGSQSDIIAISFSGSWVPVCMATCRTTCNHLKACWKSNFAINLFLFSSVLFAFVCSFYICFSFSQMMTMCWQKSKANGTGKLGYTLCLCYW